MTTQVIMPSKSVFFSSIEIASALSVTFICINLVLKPFNLSIGEFSHEQITAMALVGMNVFVMIQRLKPQSPLYFIKKNVNKIVAIIQDAQEQNEQASNRGE